MKLNGKFEEIKHESAPPPKSLQLIVGSFTLCPFISLPIKWGC